MPKVLRHVDPDIPPERRAPDLTEKEVNYLKTQNPDGHFDRAIARGYWAWVDNSPTNTPDTAPDVPPPEPATEDTGGTDDDPDDGEGPTTTIPTTEKEKEGPHIDEGFLDEIAKAAPSSPSGEEGNKQTEYGEAKDN